MADPLAALLAEHPWPEAWLAEGQPLEFIEVYALEVTPERLWPELVDTSRLNRALGLGEMTFEERDGQLHGRAVNGGFVQEWVERPWAWVEPREVVSVREYSRGFAHKVRAIYQLRPTEGGGSELTVYFGWIPRHGLGRWMLKLGLPRVLRAYGELLTELARSTPERPPSAYRVPRPSPPAQARREAERVAAELIDAGRPEEEVRALVEHVLTGDELDLDRLHPRALARGWGTDPTSTLVTFLHATRRGLLQLSWDLICPRCRGLRDETRALSALKARASCEACALEFSSDHDKVVEISFRVHPTVREVPRRHYCSAEPAAKRHIHLQLPLGPGQERRVELAFGPGCYRARVVGSDAEGWLTVGPGLSGRAGWSDEDSRPSLELALGGELAVINGGSRALTFVVEDPSWADEAIRPAELFSLQDFRDLFSEEYLADGLRLAVGEQTLLFTDIVGSTRLYLDQGDADAFIAVRRHFDEVFAAVADNRGAVIKTIGDAVMAAFAHPQDALRAGEGIHRRFPPGGLRLRVSLHRGACIAVNLNDRIDYFGTTVNLAAKLQALPQAGEIAASRETVERPDLAAQLAGATLREEQVRLPGFEEPVGAVIWAPHPRG